MYSAIIKGFNTLVINTFLVLSVNNVVKSNFRFFSLHTLLWLLVSISPCLFVYTIGYNFLFTVLSFVSLTISLHRLFNISLTEGMMFTLYFMLMSIIPDLIASSIIINYLNYKQLCNNLIVLFISNLFVSVSTYYLFKVPFIKKIVNNSMLKISKSKHRNVILYIIISFIAICVSCYGIIEIYKPTHTYFAINIVAIILATLVFIYISELIKYNQLQTKNEILYECMKNIETYQEEQDLKIHEYKNQLSKITALTNDKIVLEKLEEILNVDLTTDVYLLSKLKKMPKGELKSLIYYKLLIANKENIKLSISIADLNNDEYEFNAKQEKCLCNLIGIFFDNAIEAAKESDDKEILFEVYDSNLGITFFIENSFNGNLNINKIDKKGYTTKGKGRGNGLYFAKKIVNKNKGIYVRKLIKNNLFAQKIIIEKE